MTTEFSPLMLVVARESRKLSQTALAKAAGVSQSAVSQLESGIIAATEATLEALASVLDYPTSLFYQRIRYQQLPLTFFRKKSRVGVREVAAIRARVNLYRLRIETLLRGADIPDARIALADLSAQGLKPEDAANRLRTYWNVPPGPIKDLTSLVESFGVIVVPIDFGTQQVDGLSLYEPSDTVPPLIFLNPSLPPDRWRMTLAHELGHIALHHHLPIPGDEKAMEAEAFAFAQEFLMPRREIWGQLSYLSMTNLAALKRHWRVSMRGVLKRAEALGRISDRHARRLWTQLSRDGVVEQVEIAGESATSLKRLVENHTANLGYSQRDLSKILHLRPEELRSDFGLTSGHLRIS